MTNLTVHLRRLDSRSPVCGAQLLVGQDRITLLAHEVTCTSCKQPAPTTLDLTHGVGPMLLALYVSNITNIPSDKLLADAGTVLHYIFNPHPAGANSERADALRLAIELELLRRMGGDAKIARLTISGRSDAEKK